jgi:predicted PurR-regulated permease PerM
MFVVFLILAVGFAILKIDYGILLAVLIAFLDFLPMLGTGTALIPWALFFALSGSWARAAGLLILYAVTQVTRQLIQPKMVGDSIGVDTLTTLFLLFIGWRLGGIIGMILAIPIGVILIQLYEAGAFDLVLQSIRELYQDIHSWRTSGKE